jgi:hypothetical protein
VTEHIPPGSAVITPNEMLNEIRQIHTEIRDLRVPIQKLADVVPDHEARIRKLEERADGGEVLTDVQDHETRIRGLERARWLIAGFAAGGGGTVGAIVTRLLGG